MPLRAHPLIRTMAFCTIMVIHAILCGLISAAMLAQKAGAYEVLQFSMDIMVMFSILALMLFRDRYRNAEPSRVSDLTCFSIVFSSSVTGAMGLAIHAASGSSFCGAFLSSHPEKCREAGLAIALSWISVIVAIAGFLVSWLGKYPGTTEVPESAAQRWSLSEFELLRHQPTSKVANVQPCIQTTTQYTASRTQDSHQVEGPAQPSPVQTVLQPSRRERVPSSSLPLEESSGRPLMLHRQIQQPFGQAPRNHAAFLPINNPRNFPTGKKVCAVDERDMWKQKFLV